MTVTGIERTKKGRFSVFCDGEFACALHPDIFSASSLRTGGEVSRSELEELRRESEMKITKDRALRLLSARSYTAYGLRRKLEERTGEDCAGAVVGRMIELGLVNDADYARRYADHCVNQKGFSLRRVKQALLEKGISQELAEEVLAGLDEDPRPAIARVISRKYMRCLEDEKGAARTFNALLRLGYRHGDIRAVIENLMEDPGYYETEGEADD